MHFIRVGNDVSNAIVSITLFKVCIIILLPHDGMSNPFLWQAFSIFLIFCSLTCDSTPAALDCCRWGGRLGGGKKEWCKGTKRALFLPLPVTLMVQFGCGLEIRSQTRGNPTGCDCWGLSMRTWQWRCLVLFPADGSGGLVRVSPSQGPFPRPLCQCCSCWCSCTEMWNLGPRNQA